MGIEWYMLCESDMTAYELGKGAWQLADLIAQRAPAEAVAAEIRSWFASFDDEPPFDYDTAALTARVIAEVEAFRQKPGVRIDNDCSWDEVWIDRDGRDRTWAAGRGYHIYKLAGSRYARDDERTR